MKLLWRTAIILAALAVSLPFPGQARNLDLPDIVLLDKLVELYSGAEFDHEYHMEIADDCTLCHHHTVGLPARDDKCGRCHKTEKMLNEVSCGNCHAVEPFAASTLMDKNSGGNVYHIDKPGLKAAYHLNCMNCHAEMGGPEGCEDCHERTDKGDAFYRSDKYAPNKVNKDPGH